MTITITEIPCDFGDCDLIIATKKYCLPKRCALYRYDFHVHASERSACARVTEKQQITAAIQAGLTGIAFTDHHKLIPPHHLEELNNHYAPLKIFTGIEITADHEDWLVYGINDPRLEQAAWTYPDLYQFVRSRQGLIVLAHPFRYQPSLRVDISQFLPDGIELHSRNTPVSFESQILALAQANHMHTFSNSDAHLSGDIGKYFNVHSEAIVDDQHLAASFLRKSV
jgi:predicted metal-dependent phosphoesterase TrpH